jgi:cytochrome c oxidase assembly factor CtaG/putative copper export protein
MRELTEPRPTGPDEGEAVVGAPWTRVLALVLAAVVAVVVGIAFSGAAVPELLRDPGAAVRWGLPITSTLADLAASVTLGALVLAVCVLPRAGSSERARGVRADGRAYPRSLLVAGWAAGVWTVVSIAELVLRYASIAGRPLDSASFGQELGVFVTDIELGRALLLITLVAAVVTALALVVATPTGAAWTAALALVALWQQSQLGHAAGAASHDLATSSMLLHLVGAAVWIGTLAALAVLVRRAGADLSASVARYSSIAAWCFVGVAVSGTVNGLLRLSTWSDLGTRYGILLLAKVALFAVIGLLGLAHRRSVIPRLAGGAAARGGLRLFWRLVLVELAVMGAVSGVAVALSSTAPPVADAPPADPTPAYLITGHPLPPEPTLARWFTEWRWDLVLASAAVAGLVVYWRWVLRLRRRGDAWPWARTASWSAGMVLFFWVTSGGPALYGHVLFSAHMVQHMLLAMVVPLFLVLSAPVTLALRALPVRATVLRGDDSRGPREWILVLVNSHVGQFFANPIVAAVNFVGSMLVFYYSGVFEWALRSPVGHLAMVVHFSLAGYLFVNAMIGIDPGPKRPPYPQRLLLLFATMAFHAFFGVTLVGGDSLLVADWFGLMGRPWGASAIADQQAGGAVTWGFGEIPTLVIAIAVAFAWSRDDDRAARRRDRQVDRDGDQELDDYNAMLARLSTQDPH